MIDRAFEWLFENHPILFYMLIGDVLILIGLVVGWWLDEQIIHLITLLR